MQNLIYLVAILTLGSGLFIMITSDNYLRKIIGLGVMQSSVLIFYIALGKVNAGAAAIQICPSPGGCPYVFSSPLPQVLMLTAIVVGFASMSVGLALIYQIHREFGSILESKISSIEDN